MRHWRLSCAVLVAVGIGWSAGGARSEEVFFNLGGTIGAPGEPGVSIPLSIELDDNVTRIAAWSAVIRYDPSVLTNPRAASTREAEFFTWEEPASFVEDGTLSASMTFSDDEAHMLSFTTHGQVAQLLFCVSPEAPMGMSFLEVVRRAERLDGTVAQTSYSIPAASGREPRVRSGSVLITGAPLPGDCDRPEPPPPPDVKFQLGDAVASPGAGDVVLPFSILVAPRSYVPNWAVVVRADPAVVRSLWIESLRDVLSFQLVGPEGFTEPMTVAAVARYSFLDQNPERILSTTNDGVVGAIHLCLRADAPVGTHAVELVGEARREDGVRVLSTFFAGDFVLQLPRLEHGSLTVAGDAVTAECSEPGPRIRAAATYRIGAAAATAGASLRLPFSVEATAPVRGYSFSVDFDEQVLQASAIEPVFLAGDGLDYDFRVFAFDNADEKPGGDGVDEGFLVGAVVFSFLDGSIAIPARQETEALVFHFDVRPDAPTGSTELRFIDGARVSPNDPPTRNVVSQTGELVVPESHAALVFVNGSVRIESPPLFIRGDCNEDARVDISDAVCILNWLFLGGAAPDCIAVTNTNGDGREDISDATYLLGHLFLGGPAPVPPFPGCGIGKLPADGGTCAATPSGCQQ